MRFGIHSISKKGRVFVEDAWNHPYSDWSIERGLPVARTTRAITRNHGRVLEVTLGPSSHSAIDTLWSESTHPSPPEEWLRKLGPSKTPVDQGRLCQSGLPDRQIFDSDSLGFRQPNHFPLS